MTDNERVPCLEENLWGYGKRLRFVDRALRLRFPLSPRQDLKILDVGCGNGSQLAIPLADAGYPVTGVDPHLPSIEHGRSLSSKVDFVVGSATALPVQPFECVILSEVLEHLEAPEDLLGMALPYLADNGILIVTVPNGYGEFELDRRLYRAFLFDRLIAFLRPGRLADERKGCLAGTACDSPHVQRFTLSSLYHLFRNHGLQVIESRGTSFISGPMVAHTIGRFKLFVQVNVAIADRVPLPLVSGWMFAIERPSENLISEYSVVTQTKVNR